MSKSDCIFCKILTGEIPASKIYEDEHCLAFLDIRPLAKGHTLLIPRQHAETIDQLSPMQAGQMLSNLPSLAKAVREASGAEGINVLQNNGKVAHQEVLHVHFHLIPRTAGDAFSFNWPAMDGAYQGDEAQTLAGEIRSRL
jgi:histidine triad (HIT) family protein